MVLPDNSCRKLIGDPIGYGNNIRTLSGFITLIHLVLARKAQPGPGLVTWVGPSQAFSGVIQFWSEIIFIKINNRMRNKLIFENFFYYTKRLIIKYETLYSVSKHYSFISRYPQNSKNYLATTF